MKRLPFLIVLLVWSGSGGLASLAKAQNTDHIIGPTQGQVKLKRAGWTRFVTAEVGAIVKNGDTIRLETASSRANIFCADASVQEIRTSPKAVACPTSGPVVVRFKGSRVTNVRGGSGTGGFPIVVSPRMTRILAERPTIRWLPVAGATSYNVTLKKGATVVWSAEAGNVTELVYPATAPALVPGTSYRLVVITGSRSSESDRTPNLGFSLVSPAEARQLAAAASKIRRAGFPDGTTRFLLANLYASWGIDLDNPDSDRKALNYEAINQLLELTDPQDPAIVRLLGDLYLTIGLNGLAEEQYRKALARSEQINDVQGQALAQFALGRIFKMRLNNQEATERLTQAKTLFQSFGDSESVARMERELASLTQQ